MGVPNYYMNVPIRVIDSDISGVTYNRDTGQFEERPESVVFRSIARVTPRRTALQHPIPGNTTNTQTVQFQVPISEVIDQGLDLRPKRHKVVVEEAPLMPALLDFVFSVSEVVDSGAPIEYTFWCSIDQNMKVEDS